MSNDLTKGNIPKLVRQIAIPASIGFFFNTMYNVVDTLYASIANSTEGQAALTFSFPVFMIILAISSGLGTATNVLVANALGEKDNSQAQKYVSQAMSFGVILAVIGTLGGILIMPWLLEVQNASGETLVIAKQYINMILLGLVFFIFTFLFNSVLNAQGDTKSFRNILIIGFFLNFIFNSLFLFGGLGVPGWEIAGKEMFIDLGLPTFGIAGIALSTIIIEAISALYLGYKAFKTPVVCAQCMKMLKPVMKLYREILKHGIPASLNMMTVALGILIIQAFIGRFGENAVAAYGICTRIEQIALLPTIGLNIASMSLVGQNNGAKRFDRISETYRTCLIYAAYVLIPMMAILFFFPEFLINLFPNTEPETVAIGAFYLKIAAAAMYAYPILFITVSGLQGLKRPMYALIIGLVRQIVAPIVVFWALINIFDMGIEGIWWGVLAIVWASAIVTVVYYKGVLKKIQG